MYRSIFSLFHALSRSMSHIWGHFFHGQEKAKHQPHYAPEDVAFHGTGMVTMRYPAESLQLPDHARHYLWNEIDDCIVCDKCAQVCPVACIEIEKSRENQGFASNGMPKRFVADRFDIDLSKCCFCGLCTHVCPTECLTMEPMYDYSTDTLATHIAHFAKKKPEK